MTIDEIYDWFLKKNLFKVNRYMNILYLFAKNSLRLASIEPYENKSICYYRTGKNNDKEHNIIISDVEDLKTLVTHFIAIFDREYGGNVVVTSEEPEYIKGKKFYKTQKLYKNYIPRFEKNLKK